MNVAVADVERSSANQGANQWFERYSRTTEENWFDGKPVGLAALTT